MTAKPISPNSEGLPTLRAQSSPGAWLCLLVVFALALALDLGAKAYAFRHVADQPVVLNREQIIGNPRYEVPWHNSVEVIPWRILDFNLVINRGAVFGLGENRRGAFIAFTVFAAAAGLFVFARWTSPKDRVAHVALGLILAGGIGNLYDRIAYGVVRDFLHLFPGRHLPFGWSWPRGGSELFPWVFNVADMMLLAGMGLLMIHLNRAETRRKRAVQADAPAAG
jgi:signal peptidase II